MKPKTPYQRLLEEFRETWNKAQYAHRVTMFHFPKDRIKRREGFALDDVMERVLAAKQLGYDVILEAGNDGLNAVYRKQLLERPRVIS